MTATYDIVWQVWVDGAHSVSRKCFHVRRGETYPSLSYEEILDGFQNPDVIDLGDDLVVYEHRPSGRLAAEGWRLIKAAE